MKSREQASSRRLLSAGSTIFLTIVAGIILYLTVGKNLTPSASSDSLPSAQATINATTNAEDQYWAQLSSQAASGELGTPVPKDPNNFHANQPAPMPITTVQAGQVAQDPIYVPQSLPGDWTELFSINNAWSGTVSSASNSGADTSGITSSALTAFAGSKADAPGGAVSAWGATQQGVIVVEPTNTYKYTEYLSPNRTGQLTITAISGNCLQLSSSGSSSDNSSTSYTFDLVAGTWNTCSETH